MQTRQRGVSLIEMGIVTAIGAIVATTAAPSLQRLLETERLEGHASQLAGTVRFVRSQTVLRNEPLRLSFYSEAWGTCYVVHTGARDQCRCQDVGPAQCDNGALQVKTVNLHATNRISVQANIGSILFDPLHGTGTPTGTLRVTAASGRAVHHVVNVMGRVRSCSPNTAAPALSGYVVC